MGVMWGQFWCHFGWYLVAISGTRRIDLGSLRDPFGNTVASFWGSTWDHVGSLSVPTRIGKNKTNLKFTETAPLEAPRKVTYSEHSIAIHSISKVGYVTTVPAGCSLTMGLIYKISVI